MKRALALVTTVAPNGGGGHMALTFEYGDGHTEQYRTHAPGVLSDELLAHAVEIERYGAPATNRIRFRTLTGDWLEGSRNY